MTPLQAQPFGTEQHQSPVLTSTLAPAPLFPTESDPRETAKQDSQESTVDDATLKKNLSPEPQLRESKSTENLKSRKRAGKNK